MTNRLPPLPIDRVVGRVIDALRVSGAAVVSAPPGAGKTTRIPPAILDSGLASTGRVLVVQPRRLAARMCAQRIADERRSALGDEIGYQVRFERRCGRTTRLLIVTDAPGPGSESLQAAASALSAAAAARRSSRRGPGSTRT